MAETRIIEPSAKPTSHYAQETNFKPIVVEKDLHSPERRLIELGMEHADLDALIDRAAESMPVDELMMRRLKKRRLALKDEMARIRSLLSPNDQA